MLPNNPNRANTSECCNSFYTSGDPFSRLTQQCRISVEKLIEEINIDVKNLSTRIDKWNLRREEMCGYIYAQQFIEMSGTRIYDSMLEISPQISSLSTADFRAIVEYMYQGCTQPYFEFQVVQYLREVYFLENILANCYAHFEEIMFMEYLGFYQSKAHLQSNQQVCDSAPSAHSSTSNQNDPFENHGQYQATQQAYALPQFKVYYHPITQLEQMIPNLERSFGMEKPVPEEKTCNYNSAAFNTVNQPQHDSHQKTPISPNVQDGDHSVPNQVPVLINMNQMLDYKTPAAAFAPYLKDTPLTLCSHVIQAPIRQQTSSRCSSAALDAQIESKQTQSEANSATLPQTVRNFQQNLITSSPISPLVEHQSQSVPIHVPDSLNTNPIYVCEKLFAAAVDSIEKSLLQPVIDLSHLNIPVANEIYYDMPVLEVDLLPHDSLTEKPLPCEKENHVNIPNEFKKSKCLARDHFLVKKFLANHLRWPFTSLLEFVNIPRPKSLKNSKRSARGLVRLPSIEVMKSAIDYRRHMHRVQNANAIL